MQISVKTPELSDISERTATDFSTKPEAITDTQFHIKKINNCAAKKYENFHETYILIKNIEFLTRIFFKPSDFKRLFKY
uniref:Uncharacterized protein n=1 Tax=Romanomermis culicivorax TaxID=13658 RepID=A0A915IMM1_ROMCU